MIINSLKMIFAALSSIGLALVFNLEFPVSAGIVAILSIQSSKRETFSVALSRLYAFIVAIILSYISFKIFGFTIKAFCLYLIIYIFVCHGLKWYSSIAMNSVLVSHFLTLEKMDLTSLLNEVYIFVIGVSFGIFVNLFLKENKKEIENLKKKINEKIKNIIQRMSLRVLNHELENYDGGCFENLNKEIFAAEDLAEKNYKNKIRKDKTDILYFEKKKNESFILYEMYKRIKKLNIQTITAKTISDYLLELFNHYEDESEYKTLVEKFYALRLSMKEKPLPKTRLEFENRAELYTFLGLLEEYILLKFNF